MELPDWAERALQHFKPLPAYRGDLPNPERLINWEAFNSRFKRRWSDLDSDNWRVPAAHPSYVHLQRLFSFPPAECVKQCILECAVESAWELGAGKHPSKVVANLKKLDVLNHKISKMAGDLADLFRDRQQVIDEYLLTDRRIGFEEDAPDPFELFGALELSLTRPDLSDWAFVASAETGAFFDMAATQSRPKPSWDLLLDEASYRVPRIVSPMDTGDIAVVGSRSNRSDWSPWALRCVGRLNGYPGTGLPNGFLLKCLSNKQIADLLEVATDAPVGVFSEEQMKALIARYLKRALT